MGRHAHGDLPDRRAAPRGVIYPGSEAERVPEGPQLPHHQLPGAQRAGNGERGVERNPERRPRAAPRQRVVDPGLVCQPHLDPASEGFAEQLGAIGAIERGRLAALAMYEGEDRIASGVEHLARPAAGRRGAVGALPPRWGREPRAERQDGRDGPRPGSHDAPAPRSPYGSNACRMSVARCHRSARGFASARASTVASPLGASRRRPRRSGGGSC